MCYSATASFTAGAVLIAVGVAALRSTRTQSERPLAMVPFLFGVQQLIEGMVWLTVQRDAPILGPGMTYLYSGFSHVLWPMYVPFAMGILETVRWRKGVFLAFTAGGAAVGLYLLYYLITRPVVADVAGGHLVYISPHFHLVPVMVVYVGATCISCLFSSHGFVRLFGGLAFAAFVAAYLVYATALVSIWCFFAALLSVLIYIHLRFRSLGGFLGPGVHP